MPWLHPMPVPQARSVCYSSKRAMVYTDRAVDLRTCGGYNIRMQRPSSITHLASAKFDLQRCLRICTCVSMSEALCYRIFRQKVGENLVDIAYRPTQHRSLILQPGGGRWGQVFMLLPGALPARKYSFYVVVRSQQQKQYSLCTTAGGMPSNKTYSFCVTACCIAVRQQSTVFVTAVLI